MSKIVRKIEYIDKDKERQHKQFLKRFRNVEKKWKKFQLFKTQFFAFLTDTSLSLSLHKRQDMP